MSQLVNEAVPYRPQERHLALALQGGGSLGAFAWGVLDRLLEEDDLTLDAVSGASAGAINAVILAAGLLAGGKPEARRRLDHFWGQMSHMAPPKRSAVATLFTNLALHLVSPYQLNPFDLNPLKKLLSAEVDFDALQANPPLRLLIAATAVSNGRLQIFRETELTREMVLASASLPLVSQAVLIGEERYWDGGYSSNPPLTPLVEVSKASDLLIVQIMPTEGAKLPYFSPDIVKRLEQITFNGVFLREAASLAMMSRVAGPDSQDPVFSRKLQQLRVHHISADRQCPNLSQESGSNLDRRFLLNLRDCGRSAAETWLMNDIHDPVLQQGVLRSDYSENVLPAICTASPSTSQLA